MRGFSAGERRRLQRPRAAKGDHIAPDQRRARRRRDPAPATSPRTSPTARSPRKARALALGREIEDLLVERLPQRRGLRPRLAPRGCCSAACSRYDAQQLAWLRGLQRRARRRPACRTRCRSSRPARRSTASSPPRTSPSPERTRPVLSRPLMRPRRMRVALLARRRARRSRRRPRAQAFTVYGAASLSSAFPVIDGSPTYNFAGSNQLQLQIERGAPADLFASASPAEPAALFREGKCSRPVTFATNILVMVTPKSNPAGLRSVYGLRTGAPPPRRRHRRRADRRPTRASCCARMQLTSILVDEHGQPRAERQQHRREGRPRLRRRRLRLLHATTWRRRAGCAVFRLPTWAQPPVRYQMCVVKRPGADTAAANRFMQRGPRRRRGRARPEALRLRPHAARVTDGRQPRGRARGARASPRSSRSPPASRSRSWRSRSSRCSPRSRSAACPTCCATRRCATRSRSPIRTNAVANVLIVGIGTPVAYLLATRPFRGRTLAITLVELPLVLPPAVAGIAPARGVRRGRAARHAAQRRRDRAAVHASGRSCWR